MHIYSIIKCIKNYLIFQKYISLKDALEILIRREKLKKIIVYRKHTFPYRDKEQEYWIKRERAIKKLEKIINHNKVNIYGKRMINEVPQYHLCNFRSFAVIQSGGLANIYMRKKDFYDTY